MNLDDIVRLWYKTKMGNMHECAKNQHIFADIMWKLHEELVSKEHTSEQQCTGDEVI